MLSARALSRHALPVLLLAGSSTVLAQASTIEFTNTALPPIPLLDAPMRINADGSIEAQCVLDGDTCEGISGSGAGVPVVSLTTSGGAGSANLNQPGSLGLSWSASNAAEVCLAQATPALSGWSGFRSPSGTNVSVSFPSAGDYALGLKCFNDSGSASSAAFNVSVEEGSGGPVDGCDITSEDPNFQPSGFVPRVVSWQEAFYGNTFPTIDAGGLAPVGSFTFASSPSSPGIAIAGNYIAIPFVPQPNSSYTIKWLGAQAITSRNYRTARPADAVYVTISPCQGDFRLRNSSAPATDPTSNACGSYAFEKNLFYGTVGGGAQCTLEAGRTYYVNIVFANPFGGLTTTENTCQSGAYCDANFGD